MEEPCHMSVERRVTLDSREKVPLMGETPQKTHKPTVTPGFHRKRDRHSRSPFGLTPDKVTQPRLDEAVAETETAVAATTPTPASCEVLKIVPGAPLKAEAKNPEGPTQADLDALIVTLDKVFDNLLDTAILDSAGDATAADQAKHKETKEE